ncbi:MAG: hypothetical protein Q7J68_02070 [Thermoplasmata archaeon]|nr:hypothetical protein [Thermoplasmata archaeon]
MQADIGTVIKVRPIEVSEELDGSLSWFGAEVVKKAEEEGSEAKIRKLVRNKKE